jgi:hypothetical protein
VQWRIFLSCWFIYLLHFSPFITREQYLAMAIAERGTFLVPEYAQLHPDLFEIPGRGWYVGTNPGTSFLAAGPYWLMLPVVNRIAPVRPRPPEEAQAAQYTEERRNRQLFYRRARERGLDVRLGVVALLTSGFFMAPLSALGAVLLYRMLRQVHFEEARVLWMTMLFAVGTPVFLRAGTLSLNLLVALLSFAALYLLWWPSGAGPESERGRYFAAGLLGGYAVATDFTGVISLATIGFAALVQQLEKHPPGKSCKTFLWTVAGAIPPGIFLLWYQWKCYGNPWLPVQFHMPKVIFAGYPSEHGFGWPLPSALWRLLFDGQFGLLVFAPVFAVVLYHPMLIWKKENRVPVRWALAAWFYFLALWIFCACVHYTTRHQWQDGVRYLVPALPPLFLLVADVLRRLPRGVALPLVGYSIFTSWCVAMVRVHPLDSMARVLSQGPQFPWLTTLSNAALQYFPPLADPGSVWSVGLPWAVLALLLAGLLGIWLLPQSPRGVNG